LLVSRHFFKTSLMLDQFSGPMGYAKQHHEYYTRENISKHAKVVIGLPPDLTDFKRQAPNR